MKVCSHCKLPLPVEQFHKNRSRADGLSHSCKACTSKRDKGRPSHYIPRPRPVLTVMERIWARIVQGPTDSCWPWPGATTPKGYPKIGHQRRTVYVHQAVLEEKLGRPLRSGYEACHTCDNPPCCNPAHLWEGTHSENMQDMLTKNRQRKPTPKSTLIGALP